MANKVGIDAMCSAIISEMEKYSKAVNDNIMEVIDKTAKAVKKEIVDATPTRTGKLKKSWTIKTEKPTTASKVATIHAGSAYHYAHFTESGFHTRDGRKVEGKHYVEAATANGEKMLEEEIRKAIENG